ncbi:hypothetical protein D5R81_08800 [Parashewanella spongiae]|uniref:Receptor L-domain domain-containing protein n=1 Tax=Parashewanella spongiae TaxID=342950 RepID=A0A3A6TM27_9GAMM|nr:hypothetical protein [Parashewanella spongiae]MCL1078361.1 hypothetical protein [Parashewanella spongiae]RJY16882.1 hypothetical protein D5R81_08800 [Parashewanella spongiae]
MKIRNLLIAMHFFVFTIIHPVFSQTENSALQKIRLAKNMGQQEQTPNYSFASNGDIAVMIIQSNEEKSKLYYRAAITKDKLGLWAWGAFSKLGYGINPQIDIDHGGSVVVAFQTNEARPKKVESIVIRLLKGHVDSESKVIWDSNNEVKSNPFSRSNHSNGILYDLSANNEVELLLIWQQSDSKDELEKEYYFSHIKNQGSQSGNLGTLQWTEIGDISEFKIERDGDTPKHAFIDKGLTDYLLTDDCPRSIRFSFNSQADIDNFYTQYPKCTLLSASTYINGDDIENIDGLTNIKEVWGNLSIGYNSKIKSIEGLSNLEIVFGDLIVRQNPVLETIEGFNRIHTVGGNLEICNNPMLESVSGFSDLEEIERGVRVHDNKSLLALPLTNKLEKLGESIEIISNEKIENIDGLAGIRIAHADVKIQNNGQLSNIDGLSGLAFVEGELSLINDEALNNLDGMKRLSYVDGSLNITNSKLTSLKGLSNINAVGSLILNNNLSLFSIEGVAGIQEIDKQLSIESNPRLNSTKGLEKLHFIGDDKGKSLVIRNNARLKYCSHVCSIYKDDTVAKSIEGNSPGCLISLERRCH